MTRRKTRAARKVHTLGPWVFDGGAIIGADGTTIVNPEIYDDEMLADARLMAAAPELLAALHDICESAGPAGFRHDSAKSVIATAVLEAARIVLAKVEEGS